MIKLIGKIKKIKNIKILSIYSKNLSKEIAKRGNKISIENFDDGIVIKPNGDFHTTIAQEKRIQISITNLIKKEIINSKNTENKEIPIYIDLSNWNLKEISRKGIGFPITKNAPDNLTLKRAAIRINKNNYLIDISCKKLYELCNKSNIRTLFKRDDESIIIVRSDAIESRRICPHSKKRVQICIPKEILIKEEIGKLSKKSWLPINIKLNLESFNLKITDFYSVKEEREIAEYLVNEGYMISVKDYRDPYDIFLPESNSCIEIHNSIPYNIDLSTRHKVKPGQVRLRILEADFLIKNKKVNNFFVIINKGWENGKYIKELINNLSKGVYILYTDFNKNWYKKIGDVIINNIN